MRIRQLDLLRYGKFTDRSLAFPPSARDFHLIVGANEAGKSTTRSAILDLLYGIETRSTYDFLHAKAEMRLGATLEQGGAALAFVRTKARAKSLLDAEGKVLADTALGSFLDGTDRAFFDQMFGLDHTRLVAGGEDILRSSNDIGQILFQSAAGIGSLGAVREQLVAEADSLWARRRSGERAYYIASDQLAQAEAALKAATVRTKDWVEAQRGVEELQALRAKSRERYRAFETERMRLERVRRVASPLHQLRERQAELRALGEVVLLPADAASQLTQTELELAGAERDRVLFEAQAAKTREQLQLLHPDDALLRHAADILLLADRRQQVRNHARDIERRQLEISVHWQQAERLARELGWPVTTEEALARRLPALPLRAAVAGLIKRFPVLDQSRRAADAALADKAAEASSLAAQRQALAVSSVPPAVRAALAAARALGDPKAGLARDQTQRQKCERELEAAWRGLGAWTPDLPALRALVLPTEAAIRDWRQRQTDIELGLKALGTRRAELEAELALQQLDIAQYRKANRPVGLAELQAARAARDAVWSAIRSGERPLQDAASDFEARLGAADEVADQRHDKAHEASELQSRLDALERLQLQAADTARRKTAQEAERDAMDADWRRLTGALGLAGLPLQDIEAWRAARERVLRAEDARDDAERALAATRDALAAVAVELGCALAGAGIAFDPAAPLDATMLIAADAVERATETRARSETLERQQQLLASALARQTDVALAAREDFAAWEADWRAAIERIGAPDSADVVDVAVAESALGAIAAIDAQLAAIRELRESRVDAMRQDLADFEREVALALAAAAPDLAGLEAGAAVVELNARLAKASEERREADRLRDELAAREADAFAAGARVARARATLLPLMRLARVADPDALREMIVLSDRRRQLALDLAAAQRAVEEGGDGLDIATLEAEVSATDAAQIPALMADLGLQLDAVRQEQDALTVQLTQAQALLARIAGQDDAARAESERQSALAAMANAAERYVQVHTASRLLKWAIDRYRETRQGPMLGRAGAIFAGLTRGSFQKLSVDFDSEPLTLNGLRADGQVVGIAGMSDGTRDQLYLALRLAALEMHLAQSHAMPFIADDLFINYDDPRATAGLEALAALSEKTQVIFLSHHDHLVPSVRAVFGSDVNIVAL